MTSALMFQFHKVRLKEIPADYVHCTTEFQFHKVRLKEGRSTPLRLS